MSIKSECDVEDLIACGKTELIRDYLEFEILTILIVSNRYDLIKLIYDYFKSTEPMEQIIFNSLLRGAGESINSAVIQSLNLLISEGSEIYYTIDDDEPIYYMCQLPGNEEILKLIQILKTDMPWNYALKVSCNFINAQPVYFILNNFDLSAEDINVAFASLINSSVMGCSTNDPERNELITFFMDELNVDVNLKTDSDWGFAFLDCFLNVPNMAKKFYTEDFDIKILNSEDFWEEFIEESLDDEDYEEIYEEAFFDLRQSGIDLSDVKGIFDQLGYCELATKLLVQN